MLGHGLPLPLAGRALMLRLGHRLWAALLLPSACIGVSEPARQVHDATPAPGIQVHPVPGRGPGGPAPDSGQPRDTAPPADSGAVEDTGRIDQDGDGHSPAEGDCDDRDASVHPGADDAPYDGIDSDCDGWSDHDADRDGHDALSAGGADCDDGDRAVHPGAAESRDGRDQDCDGYCDEGLIAPGDLVITEIMANPDAASDSFGEWFEVFNASTTDLAFCRGWEGRDDRFDRFVIASGLVIPAGGLAVFVRDGDSSRNGGITGATVFGRSMQLAELDDQIVLWFEDPDQGGFEVSRVAYDGAPAWPDGAGHSLSLDPAAWDEGSNDDPSRWCAASAPYGAGDHGSPGTVNAPCPTR